MKPDNEPSLSKRDLHTLPNFLTFARILAIPLILFIAIFDTATTDWIAAVGFGIACLTDAVDGWLARRYQMISKLGKLLDPLADKLIVLTTMVVLLSMDRLELSIFGFHVPFFGPLLVVATVGREISITGLRSIASAEGVVIAASGEAKLKTAIQQAALFFLLLGDANAVGILYWQKIGLLMLTVSVFLAMSSGFNYVRGFWSKLP